ncbi:MAG TPA: glycosyltransferase family 39 protein [Steroidobacteraceae bacterium]|nr:glycosyltransferase family 39 protein [Steroidobacteraceae bacterium]
MSAPPKAGSPVGTADRPAQATWLALLLIASAALALGAVARLRALGAAPLIVDEYFIVRSVQNVLNHGLPLFDCGGLYGRGLLLQYLAALLNLLGVSAETAPRWVSAVCGLAVMPAVYLTGRRVADPAAGLLVVSVLALSVWETELSRFGRMYAPFQAVFAWYVVCFLRRTVDDDREAAPWLAVLTIVGALLWEGGVLLALANFLPILIRQRSLNLSRAQWREAAGFMVLLAAVYWVDTTEFRFVEKVPSLPADYAAGTGDLLLDPWRTVPSVWELLRAHPAWLALAALPLSAVAFALRAVSARRRIDWAALVLLAALAGALAHQFVVSAAIVLLAALLRLTPAQELTSAAARAVYAAIAVCAVFWGVFCYRYWSPPAATALTHLPFWFLYPLLSFPDVVSQVLRPWGGAVPRLGAGLLVLLGVAAAQTLRENEAGTSPRRALLILCLVLLLVTCASDSPRHETRYLFYLYPTALILAFAALGQALRARVPGAAAPVVVAGTCLALFMLSEDFQPRHLLRVDEPAVLYRRSLNAAQQSHLLARDDVRAVAQWLQNQHAAHQAVIVSAVQGLDFYAPQVRYFYVDHDDFNFESYACRYGTIDRWSNLPLVQSTTQLAALVHPQQATYLVTYSARVAPLMAQLQSLQPRVALVVDHLSVVVFPGVVAPAT